MKSHVGSLSVIQQSLLTCYKILVMSQSFYKNVNCIHSHKKWKGSLETVAVLLIYIKIVKNDEFCKKLLSENDFKAVLVTFCCYDYGANASEAVQQIATDQKDYRICSACVLNSQNISINNSEKRLVTKTSQT